MAEPVVRIVVVDEHLFVAEAIAGALAVHGTAVTVVDASGPTGGVVGAVLDARPDVALVDVMLGETRAGLALLPPLIEAGVRVAVLTTTPDDPTLQALATSDDVVVLDKGEGFHQLVDAVLGGSEAAMELERLTPAERLVLGDLMTGRAAADIADLRGTSIATVRAQIRSVLTKLGVRSQLAAVAVARRAGWMPTD